ncbi:hypothetical protein GGR51DRAFT_574217 [Nemania sp. FL0031]|nr:hypothetical protein GGR51DRAFT_574217 [Nemania sp. FL0031]
MPLSRSEITYIQSRVHLLELVETRTIDNSQPPTAYSDGGRYTKLTDEARAIADFIAELKFYNLSTDAILTRQGYAHKNQLKESLIRIASHVSLELLTSMMMNGAYVYRAVYQHRVVGIAMVSPLREDLPVTASIDRPPSRTTVPELPDPEDLQQVADYSFSSQKYSDFRNQLKGCLNRHRQYNGVGRLWEMSAIGVVEDIRGRDVRKTLIRHAVARIPLGDRIMVQVEPGRESMFREVGFYHAMTRDNRFETIKIMPEWARYGNALEFSMMTLRKGHPAVKLEENLGGSSGKGKNVPAR